MALISFKAVAKTVQTFVRKIANAFNAVVLGPVIMATRTIYVDEKDFVMHKSVQPAIKYFKSTKRTLEEKMQYLTMLVNQGYSEEDQAMFGPAVYAYFATLQCDDAMRIKDLLDVLKSPTPCTKDIGTKIIPQIKYRDVFRVLTFRLANSKDVDKFPFRLFITNNTMMEKLARCVSETYVDAVFRKQPRVAPFEDESDLVGQEIMLWYKEFTRSNGVEAGEWWLTNPTTNRTFLEQQWLDTNSK